MLFLLRYIADPQIRRTIRAETTKIESFRASPKKNIFKACDSDISVASPVGSLAHGPAAPLEVAQQSDDPSRCLTVAVG